MSLIIRRATEQDLPAILALFKVSLGEEGGIPEASFWKWKHHRNPFGESPTLLAWDDNVLAGLRTFLTWRFRHGNTVMRAYRAVDTATHPAYRGKGIFSKLTLQLIDELKTGEPSFIFNTPNAQSKPGYLKMGWKEFGKTPLWIQPRPVNVVRHKLIKSKPKALVPPSWSVVETYWPVLENDFRQITHNLVTTDYSLAYLQWRYRDIPGFTYGWLAEEAGSDLALVFYRIKPFGRFTELRITDVFFTRTASNAVKKAIHNLVHHYQPDVVTLLADEAGILNHLLPWGFIPMKRSGLTLTYREVNESSYTSLASRPEHWFFTSGSIELF